jgi:hypothetical protein
MAAHLAVMAEPYLARVLAGEKTIESRFARVRAAPYGCVAPGDTIWLKRSGGPIVGLALAAVVRQYDDLTPERVDALVERYGAALRLDADFAARVRSCCYATLIWLVEVRAFDMPIRYRRRDRRGWVTLEQGSELGTSEG